VTSSIAALGNRQVFVADAPTASLPEAARPDMIRFVTLLGGAVGLLLLVGALSVGMLLLVRTEARRDEFAMCLAIGASRIRLTCGIVLEGALLALSGAVVALPVSVGFYATVRMFNLPGRVSLDLLDRTIDAHVLVAVVAAGLAAAAVITIIAGAFSFSARVADALRARSGSTPRLSRRRTRAALVIVQTAVAVVLVAGAGLFARSLAQALNLNPGYATSQLITGGIGPAAYGYDDARSNTLFEDLRAGLLRRPSIRSLAFATFGSGMGAGGNLRIDGTRRAMTTYTEFRFVDDRYFSTIGLRVRRGRDFSSEDVPGSPLVGIVSESLGQFVANGGDPTGSRIAEPFNSPGKPPNEVLIVGVVPDVIENVAQLEPLVLYRPLAQREAKVVPSVDRSIVIRAANDAGRAIEDAREVLQGLDVRLRIDRAQTVDDTLLQQMAPQHFGMLVLSGLGALAVLLTVLGTAVLAESMAVLRRREMGIRAALGATRRQLGSLVVLETVGLVGAGLLVGLGLSWLASDTIEAFLFQVRPLDPSTLSIVAAFILLLTLMVSIRPALRAARVDLASVLREE
jgi:predicted permease